MNDRRWFEIERGGAELTDDEINEGWHFCPDWDDLLIGPEMDEFEFCECPDLLEWLH